MRRRTRRNKNPSVGGPLWNPLFHPTRPAASPRRPTVKVNAAPEVQGTACAPHRSQLERRVPVVPSWCCGPELHVSSEVPAPPLGAGTATAQTLGARSARWKLILSILILATPRRQTRRSSGMFDSDRGSNGEWSQPCVCYGGFFSAFLKRGLVFIFFFYLLFLVVGFFFSFLLVNFIEEVVELTLLRSTVCSQKSSDCTSHSMFFSQSLSVLNRPNPVL